MPIRYRNAQWHVSDSNFRWVGIAADWPSELIQDDPTSYRFIRARPRVDFRLGANTLFWKTPGKKPFHTIRLLAELEWVDVPLLQDAVTSSKQFEKLEAVDKECVLATLRRVLMKRLARELCVDACKRYSKSGSI